MSRQQLLHQEAIRAYERWLELLGRLRGELSHSFDSPEEGWVSYHPGGEK